MKLIYILILIAITFACKSDHKASSNSRSLVKESAVSEQPWDCVDELINAKYKGDTLKLISILESDCDISNSKEELVEILLWATKRNHNVICEKIIDFGIDPNTRDSPTGKTILAIAVMNNNELLLSNLLAKGASVDEVYSNEYEDCTVCPNKITILHNLVINACYADKFEATTMLQLLLSNSKNVNKRNGQGLSIFEMADRCENKVLRSILANYKSQGK